MDQAILPDSVNALGIAALIAMMLCWIGALASGIILARSDTELLKQPMSLWREPILRRRLFRFLRFCIAGTASIGAAMAFGGWPTGLE